MSGAARKAANGVARGANTPLAVEKQSGDRSGDRPLLTVALCHADARLAWAGKRRAAQLVGVARTKGEMDPRLDAGVKGLELLNYI